VASDADGFDWVKQVNGKPIVMNLIGLSGAHKAPKRSAQVERKVTFGPYDTVYQQIKCLPGCGSQELV
jgi:hypothetical protein